MRANQGCHDCIGYIWDQYGHVQWQHALLQHHGATNGNMIDAHSVGVVILPILTKIERAHALLSQYQLSKWNIIGIPSIHKQADACASCLIA